MRETEAKADVESVAGRELDESVARDVMGLELFTCGYFGTDEETPRMRELSAWMKRVGLDSVGDYYIYADGDFFVSADDWSPSTDIAAAWEVVVRARGFGRGLDFRCGVTHECAWAEFRDPEDPSPAGRAVVDPRDVGFGAEPEDALPLAICRAALASLSQKES